MRRSTMRFLYCILIALVWLAGVTQVSAQVGGNGLGTDTAAAAATGSDPTAQEHVVLHGIKDAPFSAEVVEETDQTLSDGNRIHRERHGRTFRDSTGRTRNETEYALPASNGAKRIQVNITDPVQQVIISVDPQRKIATLQRVKWQPPEPPQEAVKPPAGPSTDSSTGKPDIRKEDLGTMQIEGFQVTGKRVTRVFRAGEIGNEQPITSTTEIWYSPDLHISLLTKSESPQSGRHIRKIVNISAGDPDPLLFQLPSDYTVKENSR